MPKINVYLPDDLAAAVRDAQIPVSAICQGALQQAVRDVSAARATDAAPSDDRPASRLFGRFTPRARQAVVLAEQRAREVPHDFVGTEHALLGVLDAGGNLALRVLAALDVEVDDLRAELVASMPAPTERVDGHIPFTPLAKQALEAATKEALALAHNYIGCEHLLLGLLATEDGLAGRVLQRMGLEPRTTRRATVAALGGLLPAKADQRAETAAPPPGALDEILRRLDAIEQRLAS